VLLLIELRLYSLTNDTGLYFIEGVPPLSPRWNKACLKETEIYA
jgi:hypothetical protein